MLFHGLYYDGRKVVDDLQTFIDENTRFTRLSIDDYYSYLISYALINSVISLFFLVHFMISFISLKLCN